MQLKLIAFGLIVVVIVAIVVFGAGSVGDAGSASVSNNSSSGSPEEESAQEETAEAIVPDAVAGVDTALYSAWMWIVSLVVIVLPCRRYRRHTGKMATSSLRRGCALRRTLLSGPSPLS